MIVSESSIIPRDSASIQNAGANPDLKCKDSLRSDVYKLVTYPAYGNLINDNVLNT